MCYIVFSDSSNPFQSQQYWSDRSVSEYNIHPTKGYNPNKDRTYLTNKYKNTSFFKISDALHTFVEEFIVLYVSGTNVNIFKNNQHEHIQYCWNFIKKRDPVAFKYFCSIPSEGKASLLNLASVVFVICRFMDTI